MAIETKGRNGLVVGIAALVLAFGLGDYEGHKAGYSSGQSDLVKAATLAQKLTSYIGTPTTTIPK